MTDEIETLIIFVGITISFYLGAMAAREVEASPVIEKCEIENVLTQNQMCVISAKVVSK